MGPAIVALACAVLLLLPSTRVVGQQTPYGGTGGQWPSSLPQPPVPGQPPQQSPSAAPSVPVPGQLPQIPSTPGGFPSVPSPSQSPGLPQSQPLGQPYGQSQDWRERFRQPSPSPTTPAGPLLSLPQGGQVGQPVQQGPPLPAAIAKLVEKAGTSRVETFRLGTTSYYALLLTKWVDPRSGEVTGQAVGPWIYLDVKGHPVEDRATLERLDVIGQANQMIWRLGAASFRAKVDSQEQFLAAMEKIDILQVVLRNLGPSFDKANGNPLVAFGLLVISGLAESLKIQASELVVELACVSTTTQTAERVLAHVSPDAVQRVGGELVKSSKYLVQLMSYGLLRCSNEMGRRQLELAQRGVIPDEAGAKEWNSLDYKGRVLWLRTSNLLTNLEALNDTRWTRDLKTFAEGWEATIPIVDTLNRLRQAVKQLPTLQPSTADFVAALLTEVRPPPRPGTGPSVEYNLALHSVTDTTFSQPAQAPQTPSAQPSRSSSAPPTPAGTPAPSAPVAQAPSHTVATPSSSVIHEELGRMLLDAYYEGITQEYNVYYKDGPTGLTTKGGWHPGVDYRARTPLSIYSPVSGVVDSFDPEGRGLGRVSIKVDGTNDYFIFLHLSKVSVRGGQRVKVGDIIGKTGSTGAPPHLHVEVRTGHNLAAYYFASAHDTGANKDPSSIIIRTISTTGASTNVPPVAKLVLRSGSLAATEGQGLQVPVPAGSTATISFSAAPSADPDGAIVAFRWLVNGTQVSTARDFNLNLGKGTHQVVLTVRDNAGAEASATATISVTEQVSAKPLGSAPSQAPPSQTQPAPQAQPAPTPASQQRPPAPVVGVAVNPQVSVSPSSGPRGTTFTTPGRGFTPNSTVTPHIRKPDGTEYPQGQKPTDGQGSYPHSWTAPADAPPGTYQYWAVDGATKRQSNAASFTISAPAQIPSAQPTRPSPVPTPPPTTPAPSALVIQAPARPAQASCEQYLGKGYCIDYVRQKYPNIPLPRVGAEGGPLDWLSNPGALQKGQEPRVGAIAVFDLPNVPRGHTGIVESLTPDKRSFVVSQWNYGSGWVNKACLVTDAFAKTTTTSWQTSDTRVKGFIYPASVPSQPQAVQPPQRVAPAAPQPTPQVLPSQTQPAQPAPPQMPSSAPDPQLLAQVQQLRTAWQQLNTQAGQIPNVQPPDRIALSQDLQRGGQALDAAEAAARRGDRATVQTQLAQVQQALSAASQRLAQITQRPAPIPQQPPRTGPSSTPSPQATLSPPGPFSLTASTRCSGALSEVLLSWSASPGAKAYALVRDGQVYRDYTYVGTSLTFLNQGVAAGARYTYVVRAKNEAGQTRHSNSIAVAAPICRK